MSAPSLFGRLRQIRSTIRTARGELAALRNSMSRVSDPVPGTEGWEPAEDLHIQLRGALESLDSALDELTPNRKYHVDQPAELEAVP